MKLNQFSVRTRIKSDRITSKPAYYVVLDRKAPAAVDTSLGLAFQLARHRIALHLLLARRASQKKHFFHLVILLI
jgi:hypothetical protein